VAVVGKAMIRNDMLIDKHTLLIESIIDQTRISLDLNLFDVVDGKYKLKPHIKDQLLSVINYIDKNVVSVKDAFIKGSILSFQWTDNSDVDLLIEIDENTSEDEWRKLQNKVDTTYGDMMVGNTKHPLQIYLHVGKYDPDNADGILYLDSRGWYKGPYNITVNIEDYMSKFRKMVASIDIATGELKRNLIDYDVLKSLPRSEISGLEEILKRKIDDINKSVEDIIFQFKHIKNMRRKAFDDKMSPQELVKYGVKNRLPENVIFKLLERYHYIRFMHQLKKKMEKDKIDSDSDVNDVQDIISKSL